ncbi:MAG: hypothetical protein O3A51_09190, partial [Verrucomicrobia bacterium]|nr:hypothetical protein [Verrucomicrobiota bacterium]
DRARRESELVRVAATKDLAGVQSAAEQFRAEKENLLTKMSELAREHERERVAHEDALARHAEEVAAKASLVESLEREREVLTKQLQSVEAKQASREKEQLESMNSLKAEQAASIEAVNRLQHELQALKLAQASADEKREQAAESLQAAMALELQAAREAFDTERRDLLAEKEGEVERLLGDVESMRQAEEAMEQAYAERMRLLDLERSAQLESMEFAHRQVLARLESDHEAALRQAGDTSGRAAETERIKRLEAELNKKDAALASLRDQFNELQSTKDSDGETLGAREVALKDRLASLDAALSELTQSRPSSWYLKQDDGSVYGPVSLDVLVEWAADCRIGPGHQASTNKVDWVTVTTLSELRMVWMVTLEDGSVYGPLNLFGALELREQGVLSPEGIVVNQAGAGEGSLDRMMVVESRALARLEKERRQRTETLAAAVASLRDQLAEEPTT